MSSRPLHKELVWGDKERAAKLAVSADQERAILTAFVAARAEEREFRDAVYARRTGQRH